jgi:hypothetical protein
VAHGVGHGAPGDQPEEHSDGDADDDLVQAVETGAPERLPEDQRDTEEDEWERQPVVGARLR